MTFSSFIGLGGGSPLKSFVSIVLGFILGAIGLDVVTGRLRLTFGSIELMRGMSFIVAVIGLFGLGEIFLTVEEGLRFRGVTPRVRFKDMVVTWRELLGYWRTFLRSYAYPGGLPMVKQQIVEMTLNGSGIRDIARALQVGPNTVIKELKKSGRPLVGQHKRGGGVWSGRDDGRSAARGGRRGG